MADGGDCHGWLSFGHRPLQGPVSKSVADPSGVGSQNFGAKRTYWRYPGLRFLSYRHLCLQSILGLQVLPECPLVLVDYPAVLTDRWGCLSGSVAGPLACQFRVRWGNAPFLLVAG